MFYGCTSLATAPELPATTLAQDCYHSMFNGCTSLTTAPSLPATTLDYSCYTSMFQNCTSLTTAPKMPAIIVNPDFIDSYYQFMFYNCASLKVYNNPSEDDDHIYAWKWPEEGVYGGSSSSGGKTIF